MPEIRIGGTYEQPHAKGDEKQGFTPQYGAPVRPEPTHEEGAQCHAARTPAGGESHDNAYKHEAERRRDDAIREQMEAGDEPDDVSP